MPRNGTTETGPRRLVSTAPDFAERFAALLAARDAEAANVDSVVAAILEDVRRRGDAAVVEYTNRFDRVSLTPERLRVARAEIDQALAAVPAKTVAALNLAARRIRDYHRRQMPKGLSYRDAAGLRLGARWTPIAAAGLYVPGGTAAYPSSVLMNAIPAKVAGVRRLVVTVPAPDGKLNPLVLAAARIAGVDEIYRIGGAQAVAALAYGTATIAAVDKITGPGNAYVAAAKRMVFGVVGIDLIAGPSEVVIVADTQTDPRWIAADLLAQAEHDAAAQSVLITDNAGFADAVAAAVEVELRTLPRAAIAAESWRRHGAIIVVRKLGEAAALIDRLAPEHLQLAVKRPEALAKAVRHAGAIFLGRHAPEALGDYLAGPNHVLPTSGTARFSSGLGVFDFLKRTSLIGCEPAGLARLGPATMALAEAEGLEAHRRSIAVRLEKPRR
ncbi:MAG TPA: histidinol dehydrogenase [Alphaproteobacteria bacterium]|nr:histidinol dehydrogenase [Alphaproteobacteria bacterium]